MTVEELITLQDKKHNELNTIGDRTNEFLERYYQTNNSEQIEAYQHYIQYQHERMDVLLHDLFVIRGILEDLCKQGGKL